MQLLDTFQGQLSDELIINILQLGIDTRSSTISNYPHFLFCGAKKKNSEHALDMSYKAFLNLMKHSSVDHKKMGLIITITSTPNQNSSFLGNELAKKIKQYVSHNVDILSLYYQGVFAFFQAINLARYYLSMNTGKTVLIIMSESHTNRFLPCNFSHYYGINELDANQLNKKEYKKTLDIIKAFMFGDGAVAMLFSSPQYEGRTSGLLFGPISNQSFSSCYDKNTLEIDTCCDIPIEFDGFPLYVLKKDKQIKFWCDNIRKCLYQLYSVASDQISFDLKQSNLLVHGASCQLLSLLTDYIAPKSTPQQTELAFSILRKYGNLSCCSIPIMIIEHLKGEKTDNCILISPGFGFPGSIGVVYHHK